VAFARPGIGGSLACEQTVTGEKIMRPTIGALLLCFPAIVASAGQTPAGRWEGVTHIPGRDLPLIVDLAQDGAGAWAGSVIVPGLGIKGAPLSNIIVNNADVGFDLGSALGSPPYGPATFRARLTEGDGMAGEMRQAGNVANFSLKRAGPAQVESSPRSTAVGRELESQWSGEFELGGYPRHVTITLENHADAGATAKFVVVGKRTTDLPVDLVIQHGNFLRIESQANQVAFEGRIVKDGEIRGTFEMGPLELPLVLRRSTGSPS
jgi:hypothetical protein